MSCWKPRKVLKSPAELLQCYQSFLKVNIRSDTIPRAFSQQQLVGKRTRCTRSTSPRHPWSGPGRKKAEVTAGTRVLTNRWWRITFFQPTQLYLCHDRQSWRRPQLNTVSRYTMVYSSNIFHLRGSCQSSTFRGWNLAILLSWVFP